jgi:hypothetical protein
VSDPACLKPPAEIKPVEEVKPPTEIKPVEEVKPPTEIKPVEEVKPPTEKPVEIKPIANDTTPSN